MVLQETWLKAGTIRENIAYGKPDATMDEIRKKFGNDKITRASIMNSSTGIAKKARAQMKNEDDKESRTVE